MSKNTVRLKDIAKASNVSISTASRALRGDPQIASETRKRIIAEAQRQKYKAVRSSFATSTGTGQIDAIGKSLVVIIHGGWIRSFFAESLVEMARVCEQYNLENTFVPVDADIPLADSLQKVQDMNPDAIIVMTWEDLNETHGELVNSINVPVILFNRYIAGISTAVTLDDYAAGIHMARHLYGLGHRRIAHLQGPPDSPSARERIQGIRGELERLGCYDPALFGQVDRRNLVDSIQLCVQQFISSSNPATAIWAYNDAAAAIVYTSLRGSGYDVPGDISVAGYDHMEQVRNLNLTTFDYRYSDMGRVAVNMALNLMQGNVNGPIRSCVVPAFIAGQTTAPVLQFAKCMDGK